MLTPPLCRSLCPCVRYDWQACAREGPTSPLAGRAARPGHGPSTSSAPPAVAPAPAACRVARGAAGQADAVFVGRGGGMLCDPCWVLRAEVLLKFPAPLQPQL